MALINCPECMKDISDKASNCPQCGYPISKIDEIINIENNEEILVFPDLPKELWLGKQLVNWGDTCLDGSYDIEENIISEIPSGGVKIYMHTHGISIDYYNIHHSQIINLKSASTEELIQVNKSVIGRAVVGGLILGPLGAIIGGMSGIGNKDKSINKKYFIINFWDVKSKSAQTILINCKQNMPIDLFIKRYEKEKALNLDGRIAEAEDMSIFKMILMILFIILVLFGFGAAIFG